MMMVVRKSVAIPLQTCYRPIDFQEVEAPRFRDTRHIKGKRLSTMRTSHHYHPGNIPGNHCC